MSILQEYEEIKKYIGEEKWDNIDNYINDIHPELRLDQIIYNSDNWLEYEKWFYKKVKEYSVDVQSVWKTDYDDYKCFAIIGNGLKNIGSIIASYDEVQIRNLTGNIKNQLSEKELENAFAVLILNDYNDYKKLPTISKCSKLLKYVYDCVCSSDSSMCHIDYEDWKELKEDLDYTDKDLEILNNEIKKYGLDEVVEIGTGEYTIVGYGDLETRFIDDRDIKNCAEVKDELDDYEK